MPSSPSAILDSYPAAARLGCPVISFEHRLLYDVAFHPDPPTADPLGSRRLREGSDVTIVATSIMVLEARRAADHLAKSGISCDIIDLHNLSAPNWEMVIDSVRRTGRLIIADTSWLPYGVAGEVCRIVCERAHATLVAPSRLPGHGCVAMPHRQGSRGRFYPNLRDLCDCVARLVNGTAEHGIAMPTETSMADVYKKFKGPF